MNLTFPSAPNSIYKKTVSSVYFFFKCNLSFIKLNKAIHCTLCTLEVNLLLSLHLFFSFNWYNFFKEKDLRRKVTSFQKRQIKSKHQFLKQKNVTEKTCLKDVLQLKQHLLRIKGKNISRVTLKIMKRKYNFVQKCYSHMPDYEHECHCPVCNVNLKCGSGGRNNIKKTRKSSET